MKLSFKAGGKITFLSASSQSYVLSFYENPLLSIVIMVDIDFSTPFLVGNSPHDRGVLKDYPAYFLNLFFYKQSEKLSELLDPLFMEEGLNFSNFKSWKVVNFFIFNFYLIWPNLFLLN